MFTSKQNNEEMVKENLRIISIVVHCFLAFREELIINLVVIVGI